MIIGIPISVGNLVYEGLKSGCFLCSSVKMSSTETPIFGVSGNDVMADLLFSPLLTISKLITVPVKTINKLKIKAQTPTYR